VKEGELRDRGAEVRHHRADPNQLSAREGAERDPARIHVVLERVPPCLDGVLAVPAGVPGWRTSVAPPWYEFRAPLLVDEIDALGTVDLDNTRQLRAREPTELEGCPHRATFAHEHKSGRRPSI
jgi:hypothetical protein